MRNNLNFEILSACSFISLYVYNLANNVLLYPNLFILRTQERLNNWKEVVFQV